MSRKSREFLRFALVGACGFIVDVTVFLSILTAGSDPYFARAVSALLAIGATWCLNKEWTFRTCGYRHTVKTLPTYVLVQSGGLTVNYLVFAAVQTFLTGGLLHSIVALSSGATAALLFNFTGARGIVFRRPS